MGVSCTVQSMVVLGVEIVANAKLSRLKPSSSSETRKDSSKSRQKISSKAVKKVETKAKSSASVDWMSLSPEILTKIFSFLEKCPYSSCSGQYDIIPRTLLCFLTGVCKRTDSLIADNFPEEVLHLILGRNSPSKVYSLFESNPRIKLAFDKCIREGLGSSDSNESKPDPDEGSENDDEEKEEWDGDALSDDYIHQALDMCQKSVVEAFVRSKAVPREDIELHIAVIAGEPDEDDRTFLALKSRTIAFQFDDYTDGASSSSHAIDARPATPHAQWLAARVLSFLATAGVDMRDLERRDDFDGWRLSARARGPADAGLGLKFVTGVCIG